MFNIYWKLLLKVTMPNYDFLSQYKPTHFINLKHFSQNSRTFLKFAHPNRGRKETMLLNDFFFFRWNTGIWLLLVKHLYWIFFCFFLLKTARQDSKLKPRTLQLLYILSRERCITLPHPKYMQYRIYNDDLMDGGDHVVNNSIS